MLLLLNFNMRYILPILILTLFSCDFESETQEDILGCCDELAWNYNSDTIVHDNNLCIYAFEFLNPLDEDEWEEDSLQTIQWTGGSIDIPLKISLISGTDESDWVILGTIILETENIGSYDWVVNCFGECSDDSKWISIQQDYNGVEDDEYSFQYVYSNPFSIISR